MDVDVEKIIVCNIGVYNVDGIIVFVFNRYVF